MKPSWHSEEIDASPALRGLACALCFYHLLSWTFWAQNPSLGLEALREGYYLPMHPALESLLWLPWNWSQLLMRTLALASVWAGVQFATARSTSRACTALALLSLAKLYYYLHDLREVANFHHMHLFFCALFLTAQARREWMRWGLAVIYWMAAFVKFTPSWTRGEYFSSVPAGLPWLAHTSTSITLACWALIGLELFGPFLLLSRRYRRWGVVLFLAFHLYSGLIVGYWYTSLMLPVLIFTHRGGASEKLPRQPVPALLCFLAFVLNLWHWAIPGDARLTGEGRYLGLFMFDCNRRAYAELEVVKAQRHYWFEVEYSWPRREVGDYRSECRLWVRERQGPWRRLSPGKVTDQEAVLFHPRLLLRLNGRILNDPYVYYYWASCVQRQYGPERLAVRLWTQIDGHPGWVQTMDVRDFSRECPPFSWWRHNPWILLQR